MTRLDEFIKLLVGNFDNAEQFEQMKARGTVDFPYARHVNTVCNDKICGLPDDFAGYFMVEESYYRTGDNTHASNHLFLFTEEPEGILLTSYETPAGCGRDFTYETLPALNYGELHPSEKFTPALYVLRDGVWEGGSESMFSPVLKFTLFERFSATQLEVTETMEVNGRRTFGYDVPILYQRC